MAEQKFAKHLLDWEAYLKRSKKIVNQKWNGPFTESASAMDFSMIKTLGTGSFGRVMIVSQRTDPSKYFAMKILEKEHIVKTKQVEHTISEIRIMDVMNFQFLVHMEFFFKDNVYLFIVMPYINGGEMFAHLRTHRKFDESLAKFYTAQVILAFEYMHYCGIIYRDLKPENILIDKDGFLKVTDYGFCKKIDDQRTYTLCGMFSLNMMRFVLVFKKTAKCDFGNIPNSLKIY